MQSRPDGGRHNRLQRAVALIHAGALILAEAAREEYRAEADNRLLPLLQERAAERNERLTDAEADVLLRFARGDSPKDIANARNSSVITVDNQLVLALQKIGVRDKSTFRGWARAIGNIPYYE